MPRLHSKLPATNTTPSYFLRLPDRSSKKERVPESNGAKTSTSAGPGAIPTHEGGPTYRYHRTGK